MSKTGVKGGDFPGGQGLVFILFIFQNVSSCFIIVISALFKVSLLLGIPWRFSGGAHVSTAGGAGLIPGQRTNIPRAVRAATTEKELGSLRAIAMKPMTSVLSVRGTVQPIANTQQAVM